MRQLDQWSERSDLQPWALGAIGRVEAMIEAHVAELKKPIGRASNWYPSTVHARIKNIDDLIERYKALKMAHKMLTSYRANLA